jgi:8-oxo-dGTP pyrophosphatase MutT (NUDIX family)
LISSEELAQPADPLEFERAPFCIDFADRVGLEKLVISPPVDGPPLRPAIERMVSATWRDRVAAAEKNGHILYNGSLVGLSDWCQTESVYYLATRKTDYRHFLGTNLWNGGEYAKYGSTAFANALGISSLVITADRRLLFGRRQSWVAAHGGFLHSIGGMLEPSDANQQGRVDAFAAMRREMREELAIRDHEIGGLTCTGMIRDVEIMQPELVFDAELTLTAAEIEARLQTDGPNQEHSRFEHCPDDPEAVSSFITASQPIAAVAIAAVMLHGLHDWGRDWYEANCFMLFGELPPDTSRLER